MTNTVTASFTWEAELIETTAYGDCVASHTPTGRTRETVVGDHEAVGQISSLLGEPEKTWDRPSEATGARRS